MRLPAALATRTPAEHEAWLARTVEAPIEPELPIVDPHHHLWTHVEPAYLLDELRADTGSGHNVVATVFLQCFWAYRTSGPEGMKPVGETEFVASVAAEAQKRKTHANVCAGIVGFADAIPDADERGRRCGRGRACWRNAAT